MAGDLPDDMRRDSKIQAQADERVPQVMDAAPIRADPLPWGVPVTVQVPWSTGEPNLAA
ncbi:hypothetical protein GCM10017776_32750 [Streptomyces griseoluteus]|nr:hypothetical protein GCM10017776_32750 [Streptomyces griseoluteus]